MRVLGIDPGLNITGYGVLESHAQTIKLVEAGVIRGGAARLVSASDCAKSTTA